MAGSLEEASEECRFDTHLAIDDGRPVNAGARTDVWGLETGMERWSGRKGETHSGNAVGIWMRCL